MTHRHEGASDAGFLILASEPGEVLIEGRLAAVETGAIVLAP